MSSEDYSNKCVECGASLVHCPNQQVAWNPPQWKCQNCMEN